MGFLSNMKIKSKLIIGFALMLAIIVFVGVFGAVQLMNLQSRYSFILQYPNQRLDYLRDIEVGMMEARRIMNRASMYAAEDPATRGASIDGQVALLQQRRAQIAGYIQGFSFSVMDDPFMAPAAQQGRIVQLTALENAVMHYIDYYIAQTVAFARVGDLESAIDVTRNAGATVAVFTSVFSEMLDFTGGVVEDADANMAAEAQQFMLLILAMVAAGLVFGIVVAFLIFNAINKPIGRLVDLVEDVVDGNLNVNMDKRNITGDEMGILTKDIYELVNTIKDINDELITFGKSIGELGDYEYRMDRTKFKGAFSDLIHQVNISVDGAEKESWVSLSVIEALGRGEFEFVPERLPGKRVMVNDSIDVVMDKIKAVVGQVNFMIEAAAVKGDLEFHIDTKDFEGGWKDILEGLNHIAEAVDKPILEIRDIMGQLSQGDFSRKVEGDYAGDFLTIKIAMNGMIETLGDYIHEISDILSEFASGDLTHSIDREYVGEFSRIKDAINNISQTLHKAMSEISLAAKYVLEGASQITTSAMDLADGSSAQATSLEELHTSVDFINLQTRKFAENANEANTLSGKSTSNAQAGNEAMKQMLEAMMQIKDSSNNISRIIKVIQDIAFQPNLLSLKAAVEAARAGEHGKGFSVVAEEVRSLAARSQAAAAETTTLIQDSISRVDAGAAIAQETSESLDTIVVNANEVLSLINNISEAATGQAEMVSQISTTLLQTATTVQNNSKFANESAATAEELNSQSEMLQQLVAFFKL